VCAIIAGAAGDLDAAGATARMIDLAPGRDDGYDLTDWLGERRQLVLTELTCALDGSASSELA
jgi:hypothetical protein